jgi:outer membrane protein assembly factor BamB
MKLIAALLSALFVAACGSSSSFKPANLVDFTNAASIGQAWQSTSGSKVDFPLHVGVSGQNIITASKQGIVAAIDAVSGRDAWRLKLNAELSSGVGFDGQIAAVTTLDNQLVAIKSNANAAAIIWNRPLLARTYTAPLVAGGRIFVLTGERTVHAFDASNGAKLWNFQRASDALILSQLGTLGVYKNTLVVGHSNRLLGLNPDNGQIMWETSVASTRATNDIERLIDLVGAPNRVGDSICVRSYQAAVACVDAQAGTTTWSKPTQGATGVSGNADVVVSSETNGHVKAWSRTSGELLWSNERMAYRGLSAPLVIGNSVVLGDAEGYVHVLNRADGVFTARFKTDGSAVAAQPVAVGNVVVVATAAGGIFAFSPK